MSCGLWVPECWIVRCREVCGVSAIAPSRFELPCCICGLRGNAAVQCAHEKCDATFHAVCAVMAGFGMNITGIFSVHQETDSLMWSVSLCVERFDEGRSASSSTQVRSMVCEAPLLAWLVLSTHPLQCCPMSDWHCRSPYRRSWNGSTCFRSKTCSKA